MPLKMASEVGMPAALLYSQIVFLSVKKGHCYATNKYLAESLGYDRSRTIADLLTKLAPYLEITNGNSKSRKIRPLFLPDVYKGLDGNLTEKRTVDCTEKRTVHIYDSEKVKIESIVSKETIASAPDGAPRPAFGDGHSSNSVGRKRRKKEDVPDVIFNTPEESTAYIKTLLANPKHRVNCVVGAFLLQQERTFPSKKCVDREVNYLRTDAQYLAKYPEEKLVETIDYILENKLHKNNNWSLKTVLNYISKIDSLVNY